VPQARFVAGPFGDALVEGQQLVLRSPGLTPAQVAPWKRRRASAAWRSAANWRLFTDALAQLREPTGYHPAVLAVTGTNGKTTVTSLTGQLVERSGKTVAVAGNIGPTCWTRWRRSATPARCRRCGCWSFPASSSMAWRASSRPRPPC
jgi:UDP-N-acetylmuramoylalanine--D-glutamate ligase